MTERRKTTRHLFNYPASIDAGGGAALRSCQLCDISRDGARILIEAADTVPDQFLLLLARDGSARRFCEVVWRLDRELGVKFVPMPRAAALKPAAAPATGTEVVQIDS